MRTRIFMMTLLTLMMFTIPCCGDGVPSTSGGGGRPGERLASGEGTDPVTSFAEEHYIPVRCQVDPAMAELVLPLDPGEVFNLEELASITGLAEIPAGLSENGFTVWSPGFATDDPIEAYAVMEGWGQPVYVSAGIPLHMLHIFFDQILQSLEEERLYADLLEVCSALYMVNVERKNWLNAAYFAVPLSFLDQEFVPAPPIEETVAAELELIGDHVGFSLSPVFGYREDYSQYVPRGHYTGSERLENYFISMMWLGRLTMLLNGGAPNGPGERYIVSLEDAMTMTVSALEIVSDLGATGSGGESLLDKWGRIYEVTAFFAGFADDLSVPEYAAAARELTGGGIASDSLWGADFYTEFRTLIGNTYVGPSIYSGTGAQLSMPDGQGQADPDGLEEALASSMGFRFLGQRYTPDSEILGKMVYPSIGADASGSFRYMPTGLDVAAAFGSDAAFAILEERGDFGYTHYPDTLQSMREMIDAYTPQDWHATLYMSWLHALYLLQGDRGTGYPDFMLTPAWERHTLSTFLASWAMLRHDTILYAKQSYTLEQSAFIDPHGAQVPSAGFVEPVPEVYAELRATLEMARRGLEAYGLVDRDIEIRFDNAISLLGRLQSISERELSGAALTPEDADFLKGFASDLESAISWGGEVSEGLETTLIADVHTDQNSSSVLEVASGRLDWCMVIYRRPDGVVEAAAGPVLSYYEFTWPMSGRLTDESWRSMVSEGTLERPSWTSDFIAGQR